MSTRRVSHQETVSTTVHAVAVSSDVRKLANRVAREALNPPHLRANLAQVVNQVVNDLALRNVIVTPSTVATGLRYLGRKAPHPLDALDQAILRALKGGG
jgi:hypothetical protein